MVVFESGEEMGPVRRLRLLLGLIVCVYAFILFSCLQNCIGEHCYNGMLSVVGWITP